MSEQKPERDKNKINPFLVELLKQYNLYDNDEAIERIEVLCQKYVKLCADYMKDKSCDVKFAEELSELLFTQDKREVLIAMMGSAFTSYATWQRQRKEIRFMHDEIVGLVQKITRLQRDNNVMKQALAKKR